MAQAKKDLECQGKNTASIQAEFEASIGTRQAVGSLQHTQLLTSRRGG